MGAQDEGALFCDCGKKGALSRDEMRRVYLGLMGTITQMKMGGPWDSLFTEKLGESTSGERKRGLIEECRYLECGEGFLVKPGSISKMVFDYVDLWPKENKHIKLGVVSARLNEKPIWGGGDD